MTGSESTISDDGLRAALATAMAGAETALGAADLLCRACVRLLEVDGASISLPRGQHAGDVRIQR